MNRFENSKPRSWLVALSLAALVTTGVVNAQGGGSGSSAANGPIGAVSTSAGSVPLGTAGYYAILAKAGVSTVPYSVVTGNVGVSPIARVGLTGWSETAAADNSDLYSTSAQVAVPGKLYAADYAEPTPTNLGTAVLNMETAYNNAAGRTASSAATTNVGSGTLTSLTFNALPGGVTVYEWGSAVTIPTNLTFSGRATDVFILKVAGTLNMAANMKVILAGGVLPQNIFWQVSGAVTMGAGTHFEGVILGKTGITFGTLASINGRLLAQTAVVLDSTTVTVPSVPKKRRRG
ncbi:MAG: ice-binding family protein [Sulfuricaulis sp.]|nr:ice-binding family protein [Sulfuricaulis sp.]